MRHIISSITSAVPAGWLMRIVIHTLESGDMAELHHPGPGDQHLLIDILMMSPSLAESSIHIQYRMIYSSSSVLDSNFAPQNSARSGLNCTGLLYPNRADNIVL